MKHFAFLCAAAFLFFLSPRTSLADTVPTPQRAEVVSVMKRVADWQFAHPSRHKATDWTQAAFYDGVMALYAVSQDQAYLDAMLKMGSDNHWQPGPRIYHADDQTVSQAYCELYLLKKDPQMLAPTQARADFVLQSPPPEGSLKYGPGSQRRWSWADALFMAPPVWARLYAATGDKRYLDFMDREWWDTTAYLYDPAAHLFYRDSTFFRKTTPGGQKVFWSRGNGWVYGGLVRVLECLPPDYPSRPKYLQLYREMSAAILGAQGDDGLWRPSLRDPNQAPMGETSGSGFFCYGLAWGVAQGVLDKAAYGPAVARAWAGLAGKVHPDGRLGAVQPIGAAPAPVTDNSTEVYGVGAFLLAGSEVCHMTQSQTLTRK